MSWFSSIQEAAQKQLDTLKQQDYSQYTQKLNEIVESGKGLIDKEKINGYLDSLDKELENVENLTVKAFDDTYKYIAGGAGAGTGAEIDNGDEEIDENDASVMVNVGNDEKKETVAADADVKEVKKVELSKEGISLKKKLSDVLVELEKDTKLKTKFEAFETKDVELTEQEVLVQKELGLTEQEFKKLLLFSRLDPNEKKVKETKVAKDTTETKETKEDDDEEDDDWE